MAKTRSIKPPTGANPADSEKEIKTKFTLPDESSNPPRLFVLPTKASKDARIVTLPNPRYAKPTRYLVCPTTGIYEFTTITTPKTTPRSWLVQTGPGSQTKASEDKTEVEWQAHVTNGAELFVATAIDPVFLALPALFQKKMVNGDEGKRLFLSSEDHFDSLNDMVTDLSKVLRCTKSKERLEARMEAVCDTVDAGDETMFRLNEEKLLKLLLAKAQALSSSKLPPSMEERFVSKALEAPLLLQRSSAIGSEAKPSQSVNDGSFNTAVSTPATESTDSQASINTTDSAASVASTAATSVLDTTKEDEIVRAVTASEEVVTLQRLKVALNFILAGYVAPHIATRLQTLLKDSQMTGTDFTPLDTYLQELAKARAEAASARSTADYSRKRVLDDEEAEARAEKKRKLEEEKKRKASESRGAKQLQKVDTRGMKKMSDFFKKK